jgi:AcrR family transcriptional regulator
MKMSLREKQSAARRRQMLDAAEALIRQTGGTDFSMRALADAAEVSPATPYNFFGSKEGLLFELLDSNLKIFMREALIFDTVQPLEQALEAAEKAVAIILRDPVFLRPLYKVLLGLTDPIHHPKFLKDAFVFYRATLALAAGYGLFEDEQERNSLACSLMAHFLGLLDLWVHEDIDDDWFRAQIVYGFVLQLWPLATGPELDMLRARLKSVKRVLGDKALQPGFISG